MLDSSLDFYMHFRGAVFGIMTATFLAWLFSQNMPLRIATIIIIESILITGITFTVLLWLKI